MATFEQGFADTERAAVAAAKASAALVTAAKQMRKAAEEGDIAKIRRTAERLKTGIDAARQEIANANSAWPFAPDEEETYLREDYERELLSAAASEGLQIHERDGRLVAFPSVIRVVPVERAVRIDRQRVPAIRPSRLAATLKANQTKKPKFASARFLDSLYRAYQLLVGKDTGTTVALTKVYKALTLQPGGAASDYDRSDFGRDLFLLDHSGLTQTRTGRGRTARFSLPASTGTKGARETFSFVAPDGATVTYYGIRFTEGER